MYENFVAVSNAFFSAGPSGLPSPRYSYWPLAYFAEWLTEEDAAARMRANFSAVADLYGFPLDEADVDGPHSLLRESFAARSPRLF